MVALPNGRPGQLLALAFVILAAAGFWLGVIGPLLALHGDRAERLSQQALLLNRTVALVATLPDLQGRVSAVTAGPAADALLQGGTDAVAGADLQERVQAMARAFHITLSSVETLPPQQEGRYRRIRLRITVAAAWPFLVRLLAAVEQARPQMMVDNVDLQGSQILMRANGVPLNASFTVLAFREGSAAPVGR